MLSYFFSCAYEWQKSDTNAAETDAVAVAQRLGTLIKQQRELQTRLRGIQHDVQRGVRSLQHEQRCHDVRRLVGEHSSLASVADAASADAAARTARSLQDWAEASAGQLHALSVRSTEDALQQELRKLAQAEKEEKHFLGKLGLLSGKGTSTGGKGQIDELLQSQYADFYREMLSDIARDRATSLQVCSGLQGYLHLTQARGVSKGGTGKEQADAPSAVRSVAKSRRALLQSAHGAISKMGTGNNSHHVAVGAEDTRNTKEDTESTLGDGQSTSLVLHPRMPEGQSTNYLRIGINAQAAGGPRRPVIVSTGIESASAACVEYIEGVQVNLNRSTHVLLSGGWLGNVELACAAGAGSAMPREVDLLLRVTLAGLGMPQLCRQIEATASWSGMCRSCACQCLHPSQSRLPALPYPRTYSRARAHTRTHAGTYDRDVGLEEIFNHCKAVCHALDVVTNKKGTRPYSNVIILACSAIMQPPPPAPPKEGEQQHASAPTVTQCVLSCLRAYARARYPSLRRMAVIMLANERAEELEGALPDGGEDFLIVHPCQGLLFPRSLPQPRMLVRAISPFTPLSAWRYTYAPHCPFHSRRRREHGSWRSGARSCDPADIWSAAHSCGV